MLHTCMEIDICLCELGYRPLLDKVSAERAEARCTNLTSQACMFVQGMPLTGLAVLTARMSCLHRCGVNLTSPVPGKSYPRT